jgi:hypothetical protein
VVGPHGEPEPALAEDAEIPALRLEHLPSGETVYRLPESASAGSGDRQASPRPKTAAPLPAARETTQEGEAQPRPPA